MNKSEQIADLAAALVKAHAEIGAVAKGAKNPFFNSKYATLEAVVETVKPALLKQDIVIVQGVQDAEDGVAVETMLLHKSGQWISSTLRLPATKQDAQGYGSATTYGRRYGLMAICGVPAEDDDGNAAAATAPKPKAKGHSPSDGAFDLLGEEGKAKARDVAMEILDHWSKGKELAAYESYYQAGLANDVMLGVWELLRAHSEIRNKLKKMHNDQKVAANA